MALHASWSVQWPVTVWWTKDMVTGSVVMSGRGHAGGRASHSARITICTLSQSPGGGTVLSHGQYNTIHIIAINWLRSCAKIITYYNNILTHIVQYNFPFWFIDQWTSLLLYAPSRQNGVLRFTPLCPSGRDRFILLNVPVSVVKCISVVSLYMLINKTDI